MVIDRSGSMEGERLSAAQEAARGLLEHLDYSRDQAAIISFAGGASLNQGLTSHQDDLVRAIDGLVAGGSTDIADGIRRARTELTSKRNNPDAQLVMVVLSDGESDLEQARAAALEAQADGIRIITIGLSLEAGQELLRSLPQDPDQDYYFTAKEEKLESIYNRIGERINCTTVPLS